MYWLLVWGYEIARGLAYRLPEGSSVVLTARVPDMGKTAAETLNKEVGDKVKAMGKWWS